MRLASAVDRLPTAVPAVFLGLSCDLQALSTGFRQLFLRFFLGCHATCKRCRQASDSCSCGFSRAVMRLASAVDRLPTAVPAVFLGLSCDLQALSTGFRQ